MDWGDDDGISILHIEMFSRALTEYEAMKPLEPIQEMFEYLWFFNEGETRLEGCIGSAFELFLMSHLVQESMAFGFESNVWKQYERKTGRRCPTLDEVTALHYAACGLRVYFTHNYDYGVGLSLEAHGLCGQMVDFFKVSAPYVEPIVQSRMEIYLMSVVMLNWFRDEGEWDTFEAATGQARIAFDDLLALQDEFGFV